MANGQATFNLGIKTTADLSGINQLKQAIQNIRDLSTNTDLMNKLGLTQNQVGEAVTAANRIQTALTAAFNPKLNTVNVTKFRQEISKTYPSIVDLKNALDLAGTDGSKAFFNMTSALMQVQPVVKQTQTWIEKLGKTFLNSVRYQVFNNVIQQASNSIQQAYGYVKNLDASLNDIQIVTEKNADSMKEFAKQANNAAKSLGATTTDYTDASLIYYQQGLNDEEVAGRTDTTMKMANVLGASTSEVSDYMTAIWNNFDDGSKSLEYYGDVITKLGAETASSSEEIAEGLEKFAAVSDTVGLSYEYATSALATVVAETRQSADTVGTAFKTMFARIQDLELGNTLDDGTTLGTYSQALEKVGVDIKDQQGNLKDMDDILDEMGAKWQTLSKDEQVALAQNVAGTRQYTQLVALMDNWSEVQENINKATNATGTLETKNAIYLDSVEAHMNELKATAEDLYDSLLDSDTIKDFTDGLKNIVKLFANFSDSVGGLVPILGIVGSTGLRVFSDQIGKGLAGIISNAKATNDQLKMMEANQAVVAEMYNVDWGNNATPEQKTILDEMVTDYQRMGEYANVLTEDQKESYNQLEVQRAEIGGELELFEQIANAFNKINTENWNDINVKNIFDGNTEALENFERALFSTDNEILEMMGNFVQSGISGQSFNDFLKNLSINAEDGGLALDKLIEQLNITYKSVTKLNTSPFSINAKGIIEFNGDITKISNNWNNFRDIFSKAHLEMDPKILSQIQTLKSNLDEVNKKSEVLNTIGSNSQFISNITQTVGAIGQLAMSINTLSNLGDIWASDDEAGKKILQTIMSISMALPMLTSGMKSFSKGWKSVTNVISNINAPLVKEQQHQIEIESKITEEKEKQNIIEQQIEKATVRANAAQDEGLVDIDAEREIVAENVKLQEERNTLADLERQKQESLNIQKGLELKIEEGTTTQGQLQENSELRKIGLFPLIIAFLTKEKILNQEITADIIKREIVARWDTLKDKIKKTIKTIGDFIAQHKILSIVIAAVATAIIAVSAAIAAWRKHLSNIAAETEATATRLADVTNELKEQKDAVDDLADAYKDLKDSWDDLSEEEKRKQVYQLCLQYNQQDLAIQALTGSYADLEDAIEKVQDAANSDLAEAAEKSTDAAQAAIYNRIRATVQSKKHGKLNYNNSGTTGNVRNSDDSGLSFLSDDTISLVGLNGAANAEAKQSFIDQMEEMGVSIEGNRMSMEGFVKAAAKYGDSFESILNSYDFKAAKQLQDVYSTISDDLDTYTEQLEIYKEAQASTSAAEIINVDAIEDAADSIAEYYSQRGQLAGELWATGLYDSYAECQEWAQQQMALIDDIVEYAENATIADAIAEDVGKTTNLDEIKSEIIKSSNLSDLREDKDERLFKGKNAFEVITESPFETIGDVTSGLYNRLENSVYDKLESKSVSDFSNDIFTNNSWQGYAVQSAAGLLTGGIGAGIIQAYRETTQEDIENIGITVTEIAKKQLEENIDNNNSISERIDKATEDWSDSEKGLLAENTDILNYYLNTGNRDIEDALEQFKNTYTKTAEYLEEQATIDNKKAGIENAATNGYYSQEDIENIFGSSNTLGNGISVQDFSNMSYSSQQRTAISDLIASQVAIATDGEAYKKAEEEAEANLEHFVSDNRYITDGQTLVQQDLVTYGGYAEDIANAGNGNYSAEEIQQALTNYAEKGISGIDGDTRAILTALKKSTEENVEDLSTTAENHKELESTYQSYKNILDKVESQTIDYTDAIDSLNTLLENENKLIDNLQSSYKTLSSVEEDFANNGFLTLDNVQNLINLGPQYLKYLQVEGDSVTFNKEAYLEQAKAMVASQAATIAETWATKLQCLAKSDASEEEWASVIAIQAEENANWADAESIMAVAENQYKLTLTSLETRQADLLRKQAIEGLTEAEEKELPILGQRIEALKEYNSMFINEENALRKTYDNYSLDNLDTIMGNSSSSSSSKSDKELKYLDDEFDRYYALNKAIDDVADSLSDLSKLQEHLSGQELIKSLKQQNELLEQQVKDYKALAAEQEKEGGELQGALSKYGVIFGSDNNITNYSAITAEQLQKYNDAVTAYNSNQISEEAFDVIEKDYEKFKDKLSDYESLLTDYQDTLNNLDDIYYEKLENNLKAWETEISLKLELTEAQRDWDEFIKNLDTNIKLRFENIDANINLDTANIESLTLDKNTLETAMSEIGAEIDAFATDPNYHSEKYASITEAQDELKSKMSDWEKTVTDIAEARADAYDQYLQGIDDEAEKISDVNDAYDKQAEKIEHISDLNQLLYGENNYDTQDQIYTEQANIKKSQMSNYKSQADMWYQYYLQAVEDGDEQAAKQYQDLYTEAIDNLYATEKEYIQTLLNQYENNVKKTFSDLDKELSGGTSLDWISEQWDLQKEATDGYYDSVERVYELQSMKNKWQSAIDSTSSLKAQQKLKEVMDEEMESLQNKTELSEYDITLAEKRLAVAQAEAAFEDAQNNKNSMKLTRGADGNWSYQYVADENAVNDASQNLADAQNDAYEYAKSSWEDIQEDIIETAKTAKDKIQELELAKASATDDEKKLIDEQIAYYQNYYENRLAQLTTESNEREQNLKTETTASIIGEYERDASSYSLMTEEEQKLIDGLTANSITDIGSVYTATEDNYDLMQQYAEGVLVSDDNSISSLWNSTAAEVVRSWYDDPDSVKNTFDKAISDCQGYQKQLDKDIEDGTKYAGEDYTDLAKQIGDTTTAVKALDEATKDLCSNAATALSGYISQIKEIEAAYKAATDGLKDQISEYERLMALKGQQSSSSATDTSSTTFSQSDSSSSAAATENPSVDKTPTDTTWKVIKGSTVLKTGTYSECDALAKQLLHQYQGWTSSVDNSAKTITLTEHGYGSTTTNNSTTTSNYTGSFAGADASARADAADAAKQYLTSIKVPSGVTEEAYNAKAEEVVKKILNNYGITVKKADILTYFRTGTLPSFDTGGYTGDWSDGSGKLAMLHSKELVLNADDTSNMLEAVSAIRSMSSIGSSISDAIAQSVANMITNLAGFGSAGISTSSSNNESNVFNITADFPSASSVEDIREALLSLPNLASQFINKKGY